MKRLALAAGAGAILAAAFPSPDLGSLAWVALSPLIVLAVTARSAGSAAAEGYAFGLSFHVLTFLWWDTLLVKYGRLSQPEAAAVFLLLQGYLAVYAALFAAWVRAIEARRGRAWAVLTAPALWAGLEMLRGRLFTGLPWSLLGATQHDHPWIIQVADLGGVYAVSLVVAAGNAAIAWTVLAWLSRRAGAPLSGTARVLATLLLVPGIALAYGAVRILQPPSSARMVRVGLIQGNVPQEEKWETSARLKILDAHVEATRRAAEKGASLVVWPESSVPLPLTSEPAYRTLLEDLARALDVDLLVGSVHYERHGEPEMLIFNSAFLLRSTDASGDHQRYDKIHLVPFGEYVPLRRWLGPVEKLVVEAGDFTPGGRIAVMRARRARLAAFVCFEAIFPSLVRRFAREGAQILVNITNDAFLGDTAGPRQHLALAVFRAVENRRFLVRAANTGISAIVDDRGRILASAGYGTAAEIVRDIPLLKGRTLYARVGDVLAWACVILASASLIAPAIRSGGTSWTRNFFDVTPP